MLATKSAQRQNISWTRTLLVNQMFHRLERFYLDCLLSHCWQRITESSCNIGKDLIVDYSWLQMMHEIVHLRERYIFVLSLQNNGFIESTGAQIMQKTTWSRETMFGEGWKFNWRIADINIPLHCIASTGSLVNLCVVCPE